MFSMLQSEQCAILFMRELAATNGTVSVKDFSRAHNVSEANTKVVARKLKIAQLIASREGSGGGYVLARGPESISFLDILTAISGPISISACMSTDHECSCANTNCTMRQGWDSISSAFTESLQHQTLAHITGVSHK